MLPRLLLKRCNVQLALIRCSIQSVVGYREIDTCIYSAGEAVIGISANSYSAVALALIAGSRL